MEGSGYYGNNGKGNVEEEESLLLKRLIALKSMYGLLNLCIYLIKFVLNVLQNVLPRSV